MNKLYYKDMPMEGKKVLMRVDFNVPLKNGMIESTKRIEATLPTIKHILTVPHVKLILMSHLGRPDGKVVPSMSLRVVAEELSRLLPGVNVHFAPDCAQADSFVAKLQDGEILLLENLRFYADEERNEPEFARKLASYGDVFINDAFGTAHRAHASTAGICKYFPGKCAAGDLMWKEIEYLGAAVTNPQHPVVAILGGAKIADKIKVIDNLIKKVDKLFVGGGMAYTFLKAMGKDIGQCLLQADKIKFCQRIMHDYPVGEKLLLPVDMMVTKELDFKNRRVGKVQCVDPDHIPSDMEACDIGPRTQEMLRHVLQGAKTVIWNGPVGIFEIDDPNCMNGTMAICEACEHVTKAGGKVVIGGGDSELAVKKSGRQVGHVSTGGGASLEYMEGKPMPGVESLSSH